MMEEYFSHYVLVNQKKAFYVEAYFTEIVYKVVQQSFNVIIFNQKAEF